MVQLFQERGIEVQETTHCLKSQRPGLQMEIDLLAINGEVAVAIEVKSRLSRQDGEDFLVGLGQCLLTVLTQYQPAIRQLEDAGRFGNRITGMPDRLILSVRGSLHLAGGIAGNAAIPRSGR